MIEIIWIKSCECSDFPCQLLLPFLRTTCSTGFLKYSNFIGFSKNHISWKTALLVRILIKTKKCILRTCLWCDKVKTMCTMPN